MTMSPEYKLALNKAYEEFRKGVKFTPYKRSDLVMADDGFTVKDSGQRVDFPSGMRRDVQDEKPRFDLCYQGPMLRRYAEQLRKGAVKYGENNWMLANSVEEMNRFRQSAARHFAQWMEGAVDEDHAAAVIFNLNGYEYVKEKLSRASTAGPDVDTDPHIIL